MLRVGGRTFSSRAVGGCLAGGMVAGGLLIGNMALSHSDPDPNIKLSGSDAVAAQAAAAKAGINRTAAAGQITCPDVAGRLPAIPASARAEVDRNLALLNTQIADAERRLASSVGQGGPNFVQNAILGPLKSKRVATIDRIAISIGRTAQKPTGLDSLATCRLG